MNLRELRHHVEKVCDLDFSRTDLSVGGPYEYRINLRCKDGGTEDTAYYTEDMDDAFATASDMAARRDARKPKIVAFNTGRLYTSAGQRIAATMTEDGGLLFVDIDRGIDGFVAKEKLGDDFTISRSSVEYVYDYQARDWNCMVPFRHPELMDALRVAARELPTMEKKR